MGEMFELKRVNVRLKLTSGESLHSDREITNPADAVAVMANAMACLDTERLCVVNMDAMGHPLCFNVVSIGDVTNTIVSMQSLFRSAILSNASSIIALHNHPAGSIRPTGADIEVTRQMFEAGRIMSIPLLDHVIVAGITGNYYSMKENMPKLFENNTGKKICSEEACYGKVEDGEKNMRF